MMLHVKCNKHDVSVSIRVYAEQKMQKLSKQLGDVVQVEIELSLERNPSIRDCHVAEGTIFTKGHSLRARESSGDMRRSIDGLPAKLLRGVTKYRGKRPARPRACGPWRRAGSRSSSSPVRRATSSSCPSAGRSEPWWWTDSAASARSPSWSGPATTPCARGASTALGGKSRGRYSRTV